MNNEDLGTDLIDRFRKEALKKFKIGGRGITILTSKGKAGNEFKFRPVYYDFYKDAMVLHRSQIEMRVRKQRIPAEVLLRYLVFFGIGMAAEIRRMSSTGICPLFNYVDPDTRRRWYKMHWTRLEEQAEDISEQLIEFTVDKYLHKIGIGNPIPVKEHNMYLKKMRKADVSKFHREIEENILEYLSKALFSKDILPGSDKEREVLERYARAAIGPERWFHINRAVQKINFGRPSTYKKGFPAVIRAIHPEIDVDINETVKTSLPEIEKFPKVWRAEECVYFQWCLSEEDRKRESRGGTMKLRED